MKLGVILLPRATGSGLLMTRHLRGRPRVPRLPPSSGPGLGSKPASRSLGNRQRQGGGERGAVVDRPYTGSMGLWLLV